MYNRATENLALTRWKLLDHSVHVMHLKTSCLKGVCRGGAGQKIP